MANWHLTALQVIVLAGPALAQKSWTDAAEFEFYARANSELEPARQIEILLRWEKAYPNSEFRKEGIALLIIAYENAGSTAEAFARATELFGLDPTNIQGPFKIATLAPTLESPSRDQMRITEEAANHLLSRAAEIGRAAARVAQTAPDTPPQQVFDPETERVAALIRQWRRSKRVPSASDVEAEIKEVAERALAWARSASR